MNPISTLANGVSFTDLTTGAITIFGGLMGVAVLFFAGYKLYHMISGAR